MIKAILFDAIRQNGGSYQMSINNLISIIKNFKKKKNRIYNFNTRK